MTLQNKINHIQSCDHGEGAGVFVFAASLACSASARAADRLLCRHWRPLNLESERMVVDYERVYSWAIPGQDDFGKWVRFDLFISYDVGLH